ncbi:hypothetical protein [Actinokineospora sp. NBRC 105648]|uniref:ABC transporter substrate-binding protein n=1 Tax=Actinokineospora sp. NBRC 105648 TaxID=3032206 RepID=UPI0024A0A661|nr:hypothetical protein [Actinokineospora sp. NBRC 105648]GLZ43359.1 hypothetical protein Acsp05_69830 [Actinokineospora sp. NBRC 105648]
MTTVVQSPRLRWIRVHPIVSAVLGVVLVATLVVGGKYTYNRLFPPALSCGSGMVVASAQEACVGLNLDSSPFVSDEAPEFRALREQVRTNNAGAAGDYLGIVLLLNMTPVAGVDTYTTRELYPQVEGAITAIWRANATSAFGGESHKIKLYLANMGAGYRDWEEAVRQIKANATSARVTSVVGLGQSTEQTQSAAAALSGRTNEPHLPVIGATVTGDSMGIDPLTTLPIQNFFRVSPTNSNTVQSAAKYLQDTPKEQILLVEDTAVGDDYTTSLRTAAANWLKQPGKRTNSLQFRSPDGDSAVQRSDPLTDQFSTMHSNLCQARPAAVYFAGRGVDLAAFIRSWFEGAPCGTGKLNIVSGDDAASVIGDDVVAKAIEVGAVSLTYTALATPDQWDPDRCAVGTPPAAEVSETSGARRNYGTFLAAFTGKVNKCAPVAGAQPTTNFPEADLGSGQAMLTHDAVAVAVTAGRRSSTAVEHPETQAGMILGFTCTNMVAGASGWLGFYNGEARDKPIPMVRLGADHRVTTEKLVWPAEEVLNLPTSAKPGAEPC